LIDNCSYREIVEGEISPGSGLLLSAYGLGAEISPLPVQIYNRFGGCMALKIE
jgi:hypothetical protein